jgi:DNA topoisomerase-1
VFLGWKVAGGEAPHTADVNNGLLFYFKTLETSANPVTWNCVESTMTASNRGGHYTEASLIQKLEELGIGRPSTFASIVDTNIERGYVKRRDVEGKKVYAVEHRMEEGGKITEKKTEKVFGAEKNKLCIEPIGKTVLSFLLNYFGGFFSYAYTRNMEEQLDEVVSGREWSEICRNCYKEIKELSKSVTSVLKERYPLDGGKYYFTFGKYGPVIESGDVVQEGSKPKYIPVKKDIEIDVEKLKTGGYVFEELAGIKDDSIGEYEGEKVFLKSGRYGNYLECGETKKSLKVLKKTLDEITWEDVEPILMDSEPNTGGGSRGVLRTLNEQMSLRSGKYGCYVYYKTREMTKPRFMNIKQFPENYLVCSTEKIVDWTCKKYKINL